MIGTLGKNVIEYYGVIMKIKNTLIRFVLIKTSENFFFNPILLFDNLSL